MTTSRTNNGIIPVMTLIVMMRNKNGIVVAGDSSAALGADPDDPKLGGIIPGTFKKVTEVTENAILMAAGHGAICDVLASALKDACHKSSKSYIDEVAKTLEFVLLTPVARILRGYVLTLAGINRGGQQLVYRFSDQVAMAVPSELPFYADGYSWLAAYHYVHFYKDSMTLEAMTQLAVLLITETSKIFPREVGGKINIVTLADKMTRPTEAEIKKLEKKNEAVLKKLNKLII